MSDVTGWKRSKVSEAKAEDRGSSSTSSSSRIVNRHGLHSTSSSISATVATGNEVNETVSDRIDMLNSVNTAVQKVSAKPIGSKQYRISDLLLWMQAWSDDGEEQRLSASKAPTSSTTARLRVDCSDEEFRSIVASFYQVLHRTAANAPLKKSATDTRTEGVSKRGTRS